MKVLIEEEGTAEADAAWEDSSVAATSRLTYPEARAALASATRAGRLSDRAHRTARAELERRWPQLLVIAVAPALCRLAGDLAERQALRAYDAVHLASALEAAEGGRLTFVSWDRSLAAAALDLGLAVAPALD